MTSQDDVILDEAMTNAPQPIGYIQNPVESREDLKELLFSNRGNPLIPQYAGIVAHFRLISKLFPDSQLHPADFGLYHINYKELWRWAFENGLKAEHLKGTEGMSIRPVHFEFL